MKYTLSSLAFAAVTLGAPQYTAPPAFKITNVISGGSGCPQGSIDASWTDSSVLPIYFTPAFTAQVGTQAPASSSRKNCQINLHLTFTPGYSLSLLSASYTGWAALDPTVTGLVKSTYYFSGSTEQTTTALTLPGPFRGVYDKNDRVGLSVWSGCDGDDGGSGEAALNVNAEVALTPFATPAEGVLAQAGESARVSSSLYVQWRKC